MSRFSKGVMAMLISALAFTLMGVFLKLSGDLPTVQKAIFRNFIAALISGFILYRHKAPIIGNKENLLKLILRSVFGLMGVVLNFYAIDHLVLSDADMMMKLAPFLVIVLSALILKEKITTRQWQICLLAGVGMLFIIKPTFQTQRVDYLIALMATLAAAAAYVMLRVLAVSRHPESPFSIVFFFSGFSTLILLPPLLYVVEPMSAIQWVYLILAGVAATFGQFGVTLAYHYASAKEVSIYSYSSVLFSAIFSMILFSQYPDYWSWMGYLIIFISGYWMFLINRQAPK